MALIPQPTRTTMNKNNKADEERFVCDNWDNPEVKLEGKGKGKAV